MAAKWNGKNLTIKWFCEQWPFWCWSHMSTHELVSISTDYYINKRKQKNTFNESHRENISLGRVSLENFLFQFLDVVGQCFHTNMTLQTENGGWELASFQGIPFKPVEFWLSMSGDSLQSGEYLNLFLPSDVQRTGEEDGLSFLSFEFLVGLLCTSPNVKVAFMGPCFIDGDAIFRTLWLPCPDIISAIQF